MPPSHVLHRLQRTSARGIAVDPFLAPSTSPLTLVDPRRPPSTPGVCATVDVAGRVLGACACLDTRQPTCFRNETAMARGRRRDENPVRYCWKLRLRVVSGSGDVMM